MTSTPVSCSTDVGSSGSLTEEVEEEEVHMMQQQQQRISTTSSFPGFYPVDGERLPSNPSRYSSISEYVAAVMGEANSDETGRVDSDTLRIPSSSSSERMESLFKWLNTIQSDSVDTTQADNLDSIMKDLLEPPLPPPTSFASRPPTSSPAASRDSNEPGGHASTSLPSPLNNGDVPSLADLPMGDVNQRQSTQDLLMEILRDEQDQTPTLSSEANEKEQDPPPADDEGGYITNTLKKWDVLCGRGGKTNRRAGNKRYRHVITEMKKMYRDTSEKTDKTGLSHSVVAYIHGYGGRFVRKHDSGGYYVLTKNEARKKTSQCLREKKTLKWTNY